MRVTGVDGCRSGWVAVDLDSGPDLGPAAGPRGAGARGAGARGAGVQEPGVQEPGVQEPGVQEPGVQGPGARVAGVRLGPDLDALLSGCAPDHVVGIDMPLGLLDRGWRAADREARPFLGPRRSSIFAIPPGPVWQEPSYGAANQRCRTLTGNGFSVQAWGLRPKLLEANDYRRRCPHPLFEVHPELSFRTMAGAPLPHPKHTAAGHAERLALLAEAGLTVAVDGALRRVAVDVLDAAAVAWTARRIAAGLARTIPDPPQTGPDGREIAIRY